MSGPPDLWVLLTPPCSRAELLRRSRGGGEWCGCAAACCFTSRRPPPRVPPPVWGRCLQGRPKLREPCRRAPTRCFTNARPGLAREPPLLRRASCADSRYSSSAAWITCLDRAGAHARNSMVMPTRASEPASTTRALPPPHPHVHTHSAARHQAKSLYRNMDPRTVLQPLQKALTPDARASYVSLARATRRLVVLRVHCVYAGAQL